MYTPQMYEGGGWVGLAFLPLPPLSNAVAGIRLSSRSHVWHSRSVRQQHSREHTREHVRGWCHGEGIAHVHVCAAMHRRGLCFKDPTLHAWLHWGVHAAAWDVCRAHLAPCAHICMRAHTPVMGPHARSPMHACMACTSREASLTWKGAMLNFSRSYFSMGSTPCFSVLPPILEGVPTSCDQ